MGAALLPAAGVFDGATDVDGVVDGLSRNDGAFEGPCCEFDFLRHFREGSSGDSSGSDLTACARCLERRRGLGFESRSDMRDLVGERVGAFLEDRCGEAEEPPGGSFSGERCGGMVRDRGAKEN